MDTKEFLEIFEKAEKGEFKKKEKQSFADLTLSKQAIFAIVLLALFLVSSTYFVLSFNSEESRTSKKTSTSSSIKPPPNIHPTPSKVTLDGTITCLPSSIPSASSTCEIGIKTKDGFYYKIPNISKSELEVGKYTIGKSIRAEGILDSPKILQKASSLTGINLAGSFYIVPNQVEQPDLAPGVVNTSPTPTIKTIPTSTPTSTPAQTPTPTPIQSRPTPILASPGSVRYILENSQTLNGQVVSVSAYLIDGYIGQGACDFIDPCDHWVLTIADNNSDDLTNNYFINLNISQSEKEENYTAGTIVNLRGRVIVNPDSVILEKVY